MVTVCIFQLRDIMRTVHLEFKIPKYGTKHADPSASTEISDLAKELQANKIQEYDPNRTSKASKTSVRDLIHRGTMYADTPKAFRQFGADPRRATNHGVPLRNDSETQSSQRAAAHVPPTEPPSSESHGSDTHFGDGQQPDGQVPDDSSQRDLHEELVRAGILDADEAELWAAVGGGPTDEDLAVDDEEFYLIQETLLQQAKEFADAWASGKLDNEMDVDEEEDDMYVDEEGDYVAGSRAGERDCEHDADVGPTEPVDDIEYELFRP